MWDRSRAANGARPSTSSAAISRRMASCSARVRAASARSPADSSAGSSPVSSRLKWGSSSRWKRWTSSNQVASRTAGASPAASSARRAMTSPAWCSLERSRRTGCRLTPPHPGRRREPAPGAPARAKQGAGRPRPLDKALPPSPEGSSQRLSHTEPRHSLLPFNAPPWSAADRPAGCPASGARPGGRAHAGRGLCPSRVPRPGGNA